MEDKVGTADLSEMDWSIVGIGRVRRLTCGCVHDRPGEWPHAHLLRWPPLHYSRAAPGLSKEHPFRTPRRRLPVRPTAARRRRVRRLHPNPRRRNLPLRKTAAPLSELLLTPEEFPEPFGAVVLPPQAVPMAAPDLVGVPRGATVDPSECEPPEQDYGPNGTVMAVGTDNATRATISVELTKVDAPLDELEAQTRQCPSMTVTANGVTTTVTTEILPPSPIDADKTMSLRRTVVSPQGHSR